MKPIVKTIDFLVIGGGVAGLRAAIELAGSGTVLVLTKDRVTESSTEYAQGGIAAALSDEDEVSIHYEDTINAGDGLCHEEAVKVLVEEGPGLILELISWGAEFDKEGSSLSFSREAAHSRKRILHSRGDATGREIERVLINKARLFPSLSRLDFAFTLDLIVLNDQCVGARVFRADGLYHIIARVVVLATGGAGQVFSRTTNPPITTGDGIAIAYRAGALIVDMEFVQFHPTTLYAKEAPPFLLSEAMRGEGAILRNVHGRKFMSDYHEMAELAPRDAVARAIVSEMVKTGASHVYLDLRHLSRSFLVKRFPLIYSTCLQYDFDITRDLIPVSPAVHYLMGGVHTDLNGRTSLKGLFAAGEVACTGVHGANRLASNSLLEGLVFGARTGREAAQFARDRKEQDPPASAFEEHAVAAKEHPDSAPLVSALRQLMWDRAGIIRCGKSLSQALQWFDSHDQLMKAPCATRRDCELQNMLIVGELITEAAMLRNGSIGAHYRSDFRERGQDWQKHTASIRGKKTFWIDGWQETIETTQMK